MNFEIGTTAGDIWRVLDARGELSLTELKKAVKGEPPVLDWALGWLAREEKIVISPVKKSFRVRLK